MRLPNLLHPHRRARRDARTLTGVGALTARWLRGDLHYHPTYPPMGGRYGPDPETTDNSELLDALVALNLAGFVTIGSQPGYTGPGVDGRTWRQRAYVQGYCDHWTAWRLYDALHPTGERDRRWAWYELRPVRRRADRQWHLVDTRDGRPANHLALNVRRAAVAREFAACHRHARWALADAWQVTIVGLAWGSNDLWPVLRRAAEQIAVRPVTVPPVTDADGAVDAAPAEAVS